MSLFGKRLLDSYQLQIAVLLIAVFISYWPSLTAHFNSDDMWQVNFAYQVFNGHPELVWRNFTSSYLQLPELLFYRPLLGFTFLFDYLIWKTNSTGYHVTNALLLFLNTILLFDVLRQLTRNWPALNASLAGFGAALLFAATPLHIEAVTWISGRADLLCGVFYLCSLNFFIRHLRAADKSSRYYLPASLICFWLGLLSKEIAVGLPIVATAAWLLLFRQPANEQAPRSTGAMLKALIPFFLSVPVYLFIRQLALGTVIGGYMGTLSHYAEGDLAERWSSPLAIEKALFPIPDSVTDASFTPQWIMAICLCVSLLLSIVRVFLARAAVLRMVAFLCVWMLTTLLPLLNLWGTGGELQGSRLLFFFSMAYSTLWPVVLFHPPGSSFAEKIRNELDKNLCLAGTVPVVITIALMIWTTIGANRIWYQGGNQLKSIVEQTVRAASAIPDGHRIVVLGIPQDYKGVPVIYEGFTFHQLLRPPFTSPSVSDKVVTFIPSVPGGTTELINANLFRRSAADASTESIYFWNSSLSTLDKVDLSDLTKTNLPTIGVLNLERASVFDAAQRARPAKFEADKLLIDNVKNGDYLEFSNLGLPPFPFDYVRLKILVRQSTPEAGKVTVSWFPIARTNWTAPKPVAFSATRNEEFTFHARVSKYQEWFASERIDKLRLKLLESDRIEISEVSVINGGNVFPDVDVTGARKLNSGEYVFEGRPIEIAYSAAIPGCDRVELMVSKPNFCFDYTYWRTESLLKSLPMPSLSGRATVDQALFQKSGYYQIAARALTRDGNQIGDWSDCITVFNPGKDLEHYLF